MSKAVVGKWRPPHEKCEYCWAMISWDAKDLCVTKGRTYFVSCPDCGFNMSIDGKDIPPAFKDIAQEV